MYTKVLLGSILYFTVNLTVSFVFFIGFWLHLDSFFLDKKKFSFLLRSFGFALLSIFYLYTATTIQLNQLKLIMPFAESAGLIIIILSLLIEPILPKPKTKKIKGLIPFSDAIPKTMWLYLPISFAFGYLLICLIYLRKVIKGLEKQVKPAAWAFFFLFLAKLVNTASVITPDSVFWMKIYDQFGIAWFTNLFLLTLGSVILGLWLWGYLRFRLQPEIFISTTASTLIIFTLTTTFFTFLLLNNIENDALSHMRTDVKLLKYSLETLQFESFTKAESIAQDPEIISLLGKEDKNDLYNLVSGYVVSKNLNFLDIVGNKQELIIRVQDRERNQDLTIADPLIESAIAGQRISTISLRESPTVPQILVKSVVPITKKGQTSVLGAVSTGYVIDSAFVDGVKSVTGLDITIFSDNKRSATTLLSSDGLGRNLGTKETNQKILKTVLSDNQIYAGPSLVANQPYYSVYMPLKTYGDKIIGMLYVGKPQSTLIESMQKSIQLTFLGSAILIILSIIPSFLLSKYLEKNLEA